MSDAILLYTVVAIGPIPPEIEIQEVQRSRAQFLLPFLHTPASSLAHLSYSTALGTCCGRDLTIDVQYTYRRGCNIKPPLPNHLHVRRDVGQILSNPLLIPASPVRGKFQAYL